MAVTKTMGPLHFEDLEPKRFEDLVREMVYDFKDWQSIEATGRSGSDDGFDIRAYERVSAADRESEDRESDEDDNEPHPMEGNLWMFQCKRETEIGPTKVGQIIRDGVKADRPPYGYVLAAPANFSKKSFDLFRDELRKLGVMEFYLWGRAALEDMLHLPKNDRVLFAFFGISLVTRRRSRATDVRAIVARKNKLIRTLGDRPSHKPILVRDLKDIHYPDGSHYKDFDNKALWQTYHAIALDARGLVLRVNEYFAYRDPSRGEWDMTEALNLARPHEGLDRTDRREDSDLRDRIEAYWHFIPHAHRAMYMRNGLVRFEDIAVIDDKGDPLFDFPHIYVDFHEGNGPFFAFGEHLRIHEHQRESIEGLKRVERFPAKFDAPRVGTVHDSQLEVPQRVVRLLSVGTSSLNTLYDVEGQFDSIEVADVIAIERTDGKHGKPTEPILIQITHKRTLAGGAFLESLVEDPSLKHQVEEQVGREVAADDQLRIVEFQVTHQWKIDRAQGRMR